MNGLTPERVVEIHSSAEYLVYFLGFSPGFPYLGGLPASIATPRLDAPRTLVPAAHDPRAAYFRQMEYGLYVRMALLAMVLGKA